MVRVKVAARTMFRAWIRVGIRVIIRVGIMDYVNVWVIAKDAVMVTSKVSVRLRVRDNTKHSRSLSLTPTHVCLLKMNSIKLLRSDSI